MVRLAMAAFAFAAAAQARQQNGSAPQFPVPPGGAGVFQRACAGCHASPPPDSRAPSQAALADLPPDAIVTALATGRMRAQGEKLTEAERREIAEFLTGRSVGEAAAADQRGSSCRAPAARFDPGRGPSWNGWSPDATNVRYQPAKAGGLTAANVSKLRLQWAFGFPAVLAARTQPTIVGGRLFTASDAGAVYSLDAKTGCTYWTFHAQAGVRTAISVGPYRTADGASRYAAYFGDGRANAYAVDVDSGQPVWVRRVDDHPNAAVTGAPVLYGGRLFVPTAGVGEEGQSGRSDYECCTFRGSVTALDASTGAPVWKTFSIAEEPKPRAKNRNGIQKWGPAGGGIWAAPTVDAKRQLLYVATGNGYADPPQRTTDAVIAVDLGTGRVRWVSQLTPGDVWAFGCPPESPDDPNCPAKEGPDFDFSASPALVHAPGGRDLLVIPQKSGLAYALDPDREGAVVWQYRFGKGSGLGGQWGAASDGRLVYVGVGDFLTDTPGGVHAIDLATGSRAWFAPPPGKLCGSDRQCSASQGAAVTAIPGAVLASSHDGGVRAYSARDGSILWQFDTNREFQTVNGVKAQGGAIDGPGPVVAGGMLYVNSGYGGLVGRPGNVLLAFGLK